MKKLFASFVIIYSVIQTTDLQAQTERGGWLIEGGIGNIKYFNKKEETVLPSSLAKSDQKGLDLSLLPTIGYFIGNNLVLGTTLEVYFRSDTYTRFSNDVVGAKSEQLSLSIRFMPFIRYYFPNEESKTKFYGQFGGGLGRNVVGRASTRSFDPNGSVLNSIETNPKVNVVRVGGLLGLNHFFSYNLAFNMAIGVDYQKYTQTTSLRTTSKGIEATWLFGFTFVIPSTK